MTHVCVHRRTWEVIIFLIKVIKCRDKPQHQVWKGVWLIGNVGIFVNTCTPSRLHVGPKVISIQKRARQSLV